jgi:mRNA interferase MazF
MSLILTAGQIVLMNLRDALPNEPGRLRPCVVIEDRDLFGDAYANVIVVPLTHDRMASFSLVMTTIDPTPENGCDDRSYALAAHVASYSRNRIVNATKSRVTDEQLAIIRAQVALAIAA